MNSSSAPQPVDTQGNEANLPTIDATSEIGSMGGLYDRNFDDDVQGPPQTPQHASPPVPSYYQDRNNDGTLSRDMLPAQNIPSIEAGSNTASADYNMVDVAPDLARTAEGQILDNYQESHGFDYSPNIGNTGYDSRSYSDLTTSTSIGQSSLPNSSSENYPYMPADNHQGDTPGMESYPTPVSNPSYTPKSANRTLTKPRKAKRAGGNRSASMRRGFPGVDLSPSSEADSVRLGLLRSLILKSHEADPECGTSRSFNDEDLRKIYWLGDRIINETARVLNDWSEWSSREFQPPNAVLSPCHHLSPVEICAVAFRFLMETHNGVHRKSMHRRLAQILIYNFVAEVEQGIITDEIHEVFSRYDSGSKGDKPVTIANDLIIAKVGISEKNGKKCNRVEIGKEKSSGRRWWRLGSGIGVVTILACPSDLNSLM
ncbi:hypothetical protein ZTR_09982 [Talaromyces verruculosus]|nr:hypothetical protein ZTR_09982 [Talaromyces verruculosus]